MLNFQEMIRDVDQLSPEERIRRLDEAARAIRAGFTEAEWAEVERAMNEEYIEPADPLPVKRENWRSL